MQDKNFQETLKILYNENYLSVLLSLQVVTPVFPNKTICLSVDSTFQLVNGHGVFKGSICEVISTPVTISFDVTASSGALRSDASNPFEVTGIISIFFC